MLASMEGCGLRRSQTQKRKGVRKLLTVQLPFHVPVYLNISKEKVSQAASLPSISWGVGGGARQGESGDGGGTRQGKSRGRSRARQGSLGMGWSQTRGVRGQGRQMKA